MDKLDIKQDSGTSRFFRKIDWSAFWTATLLAFAVYFLSLGPSVSLEDSGELAVAGDYLGVPHPPGYPIWTMLAWLFARLFSFVTFRGQPTPAWSIALSSAFFGALAAGCTAMLITRSASDMLRDTRTKLHNLHASHEDILCWAGGVAGSLAFAFSPVMWSQSTIVEVYALGAFFLMLVMLLTYRWMRRPTERLLWATAFVFGLGLTNYQVLLLAALPLVVVIFLRNVDLFRDFLLLVIPILLTALVLKVGAMNPQAGFAKNDPLLGEMALPGFSLCVIAAVLCMLTLVLACCWPKLREHLPAQKQHQIGISIFATGFGLSLLMLIFSLAFKKTTIVSSVLTAPRAAPSIYISIAVLVLAATAIAVIGTLFNRGRWDDPFKWGSLVAMGAILIILMGVLAGIETTPAPELQPGQELFSWTPILGLVFLGLILMIVLAMTTPNGIFFAAAVTVVEVALFGLLRQGALLGLTHPTTWWFWIPVILNFVFLILAWITLPNGRNVAMTALAAELGVSFYIYMPIVSDLRNPPMNWGYPRTWEGFKHAITRGQYEKITPTNIFAPRFIQQLGGYFTDLRVQFTLLLAPLGFLPFAAWQLNPEKSGEHKIDMPKLSLALIALVVSCILWSIDYMVPPEMISDGLASVLRLLAALLLLGGGILALAAHVRPLHAALVLLAATVLFVMLGHIATIEHLFDASRIDKMVFGGILAIGGIGGLLLVLGQFERVVRRALLSNNKSERLSVGLTVIGVLGFSLAFLFKLFQSVLIFVQARHSGLPRPEINNRWGQLSANVPPLLSIMAVLLALAVVAGVIWAYHHLTQNKRIAFTLDTVSQQWLIATVAAFLVMSVLLIVLANPKGDLQDAFIQKVKFISSHGLFAIWIGYGLVFGLAVFNTLANRLMQLRRDPNELTQSNKSLATLVLVVPLLVTLAIPLIPIHQNYYNEQLVLEFGGAEQNGHDYGWQFGNYQLRGAHAITEELDADEEPLPNPSYPPAMGQNAIFFGGTDPGRFVPTYMIFSARVREDVFLITQNALADNTYMSVMRDLYGNQIWIPTPEESASAFQVYVEEVQSGKRSRNAELLIENGRVQVSGALGVMEINGILCEMIFKYNKARHPFYIEESYVIPWMYPYLTPHGLIMKINNEHTPLTKSNRQDDLDFWDWYVRRLTHDESYHRDVVARKSFSKLRSAIAGLYSARGHLREAEQAYMEARMLYPVSPEANFRMVQDVLLRQQRYDEALDIVDLFIKADPNNQRGPSFRQFIVDIHTKQQRIAELTSKIKPGQQPEIPVGIELATIYRDMGNPNAGAQILVPLLDSPELTLRDAYEIALLLDSTKAYGGAVRAIDIVMANLPEQASAELYLNIARIYANAQESKKMIKPLSQYLRMKPNDWQAWTDLATLYLMENDHARAQTALKRALELGRQKALQSIQNNPQLRQLAQPLLQQGDVKTGGRDLGLGF